MKVLLQRVARASVSVDGEVISSTGKGLLLLVGVAEGDTPEIARELAEKAARLRIFADEDGKFNLAALDVGGEVMVVSQFTLLADTRKGRRPSFTAAARPKVAARLVDDLADRVEVLGLRVGRGSFGAHMLVELANDGPVTIMLEG